MARISSPEPAQHPLRLERSALNLLPVAAVTALAIAAATELMPSSPQPLAPKRTVGILGFDDDGIDLVGTSSDVGAL